MSETVLNEAPQTTRNELYHPVRIGSLVLSGNLFLAPVAGYSDRAFRSLCVECGASFTYTEMVSAEALVRNSVKTELLMMRAENEKSYAVQLFGGEADRIAAATLIVLEKTNPECIDINAGCPVPKIIKTGAGSCLTRDPAKLNEITQATVAATVAHAKSANREPVPVTVKIRSGWDDSNLSWKEAALAAIEGGAAAITLHPRTKAQGYEGKSRWDLLALLSEEIHNRYPDVPVFGSGDLFSPEAARQMLRETGCDGVMFARGAMGNPFIFTQTRDLLTTGSYAEIPAQTKMNSGWKELLLLVTDAGEALACREMRKRFCSYSKGIEGGAPLRAELVHATTVEEYRQVLEKHGFLFE
jgi:tRNA-dihydrouridine synthase B